ncbi:hypothetical protein [Metabacillus sp. FJAT-52054]|uniref:Uncharacterized protein n=1 Tax=Metabacillus sediminis TaxID=3117746 RepID=A0ABZ2NMQ7_9BACI
MKNLELRNEIKRSRLYYYEVAAYLGVHENTLYRLLRSDLSGEQKEKIRNAIKQLKKLAVAN